MMNLQCFVPLLLSFHIELSSATLYLSIENRELPAKSVSRSISKACTEVALTYFQGSSIFFFFMEGGSSNSVSHEVLKTLMAHNHWTLSVFNKKLQFLENEENGEKKIKERNVIMILDRKEDWHAMLIIFRNLRCLGPLSQILLVAYEDPEELLTEAWNTITTINITVLIYGRENLELFTLFPYEKQIKKLNFTDGLFPFKIPNEFQQYPLRVIAEVMEPYVIIRNGDRDGVEIRLLYFILKYYNMPVQYLTLNGTDLSRINFDKGKPYGLFRVLTEHKADLLIAGLLYNIARHIISEPLYSHTQDRLIWVFPRPERKQDWRSIFQAFTVATWIVISVLIFVIAGTSTVLGRYLEDSEDSSVFSQNMIFTWGYILETGSPKLPKSVGGRIFLAMTFFYTINLSCSYKSSLVTFLTAQKPGKGYEEAIEAVRDGLNVHVQRQPRREDPTYDTYWKPLLGKLKQSYNNTIGLEAAANRSAVAMAVEFPSYYIVNKLFLDEQGKQLVHFSKKAYSHFNAAFFMAPGHPLAEGFNRKMIQLVESGISSKIMETIIHEELLKAVFTRKKLSLTSILPKVLTIGDLFAIFGVLIVFHIVSVLLFIMELLYCRCSQKKIANTMKRFKYFSYFHQRFVRIN